MKKVFTLFVIYTLSINVAFSGNTPDEELDSLADLVTQPIENLQDSNLLEAITETKLDTQDLSETKKISPSEVVNIISFYDILWTVIFILVGYFFIKLSTRVLELSAEKSTNFRITFKSFIPIVRIVGWITVIFLIVVGIFQPPAATVLAFSASIGVAVGFAAQDILKNIFGGVMILFDRPFQSGDKIEVGQFYGEVVEIGLRSTRIATPDDNLVSIPNSEIMNSPVSNANAGESNCQVVAEIYLPIDVDTVKTRTIATQAAQVSKYIYLNKPVTVIFINEFKDRTPVLKMRLKAYVLDIRDEFKFKSEMTELVIKKLNGEKMIEF